MRAFEIGEKVKFECRKAIIADRLNGKYLLWDESGRKELEIVYPDYPDGWVPADQITRGW